MTCPETTAGRGRSRRPTSGGKRQRRRRLVLDVVADGTAFFDLGEPPREGLVGRVSLDVDGRVDSLVAGTVRVAVAQEFRGVQVDLEIDIDRLEIEPVLAVPPLSSDSSTTNSKSRAETVVFA
ncbi:hypothetical protein [Halobiforma nitratireducens]|uniref:Uncharacterized protein n=1 Tax=Halobiforma nitratireducens JCM 10879 TaxID=1227454 RepID=M0LQT6_9EURY|nr:hypothetical protein [Halobiforma nitratireducens]EMA35453.1 hypothetical protein C446_12197 [Halobiforma nitratireducens JCM 10879]